MTARSDLRPVSDALRGVLRPAEYTSVVVGLYAIRRLTDGFLTAGPNVLRAGFSHPQLATVVDVFNIELALDRLDDEHLAVLLAAIRDLPQTSISDLYEACMGEFTGTSTGEYFTPPDVTRLVVDLAFGKDAA